MDIVTAPSGGAAFLVGIVVMRPAMAVARYL